MIRFICNRIDDFFEFLTETTTSLPSFDENQYIIIRSFHSFFNKRLQGLSRIDVLKCKVTGRQSAHLMMTYDSPLPILEFNKVEFAGFVECLAQFTEGKVDNSYEWIVEDMYYKLNIEKYYILFDYRIEITINKKSDVFYIPSNREYYIMINIFNRILDMID